jgi:hypothetical protein
MNAPVRKPVVGGEARADPVEVFRLRCASRAKLWHTGQIDLHSAVDELQHSAEASGLIDAIGQDAVQGLMVEAFVPLRDDLPRAEKKKPPADDEYHGPSPTFTAACRKADAERQARQKENRDHVSRGVPIATLHAAGYLLELGDLERWKKWFDGHSAPERAAILQHLEQRKRRGNTTGPTRANLMLDYAREKVEEDKHRESGDYKIEISPWWRDPATIPPREFLYGRHPIRGAISATIGAGGRAKTTHDLFESVEIATGRNLTTGEPLPQEALRVVYLNAEEDQNELDRRVAARKHAKRSPTTSTTTLFRFEGEEAKAGRTPRLVSSCATKSAGQADANNLINDASRSRSTEG